MHGNDIINGGSGDDRLWGGGDGDTSTARTVPTRSKAKTATTSCSAARTPTGSAGGDGLDTINGQSGADVIAWLEGDNGLDSIAGFNLAEDRLYFGVGFFDVEPVGAVHLDDVLTTFHAGADTLLAANTAEHGWKLIARLQNVDADDRPGDDRERKHPRCDRQFRRRTRWLHGGQFDEPLL